MSSWNMSRDCCSWVGVIHDEMTGHVVELDLHCSQHFGVINSNSSLFQLSHLKKLDLSYNYFYGSHISAKFDRSLRGPIPESLSNLTSIESLFLSQNSLNGTIPSGMFSFPSLIYLRLNNNHFSVAMWMSASFLTSNIFRILVFHTLRMAACEVKELEFLRSAKHLEGLDPSNNKIQGRIPDWAWSNWMFSLQSLNLFHNMLASMGSIPLQYFFISENNLRGEIPSSICRLTSLLMLDLERNNLKGAIPQCLGNISGLAVLDMHNSLSGTLPMTFRIGRNLPTNLFQHLKSMRTVDQTMKAPSYEGDIYYQDSVAVITQGFEREIVSVLFCTQNYDEKEAAKAKELQKKK
ncbi:hypothetical protein FXO38_10151 [Capsicum annuum]|nr:hypothetical protein FXO38_10151 [Capsicum annuum]